MIRSLTNSDATAYAAAQRAAFGHDWRPGTGFDLDAGRPAAVGVEVEGRLVAKCAAHPLTVTLGGRAVPAHGIADVTVDLGHRGTGLGREVLAALLRAERDRGAALSVLYPSIPAVYRSYGYAAVAQRHRVRLDAASLARATAATGWSAADHETARAAFDHLTASHEGALRPLPEARVGEVDLVLNRDGVPLSAIRYARTGDAATCEFALATGAAAWSACLALLGSETGLRSIEVWSTPHDPIWHWHAALPEVVGWTTPMLRVVDVVAALEGRGWPATASGTWQFTVTDRLLPENDGGYELTLTDGRAHARRVAGSSGPSLPSAHLAALVAGVRHPGDPQWEPLPPDLVGAASLRPWTISFGF